MNDNTRQFLEHTGIELPLICGAMYPCSNPELIAAVSDAGGIGIIQPISMQYVHGHDLREGIRYMKTLTDKPIGFNAIVEKSSDIYMNRMKKWIDIALEEGVRFFITALGNPRFVCEKVHAMGGVVYHDVTERKWAQKAIDEGVDGLICVNSNAGGHAGALKPQELFDSMSDLGVPLVCAGGVGDEQQFLDMINIGYGGVQLGTRFIATQECKAHNDYKSAICDAKADDIVLTERISGVPVAIIKTPFIEKTGTEAGWLMKKILRHRKLKHYGRMYYSVKSLFELKKASLQGMNYKDFFQAGKSVSGIHEVESAKDVVARFAQAYGTP
ncbi:MAG: 2-nitropropane dioxygenase [Myxococcales bacterium]|nr:2-nitropropane dioxygenase [Myxococcales bacterium]|tara:strand:- start:1724 stop:2707 length:984 start_codon:yes stop_codon:yes gene_type:complete